MDQPLPDVLTVVLTNSQMKGEELAESLHAQPVQNFLRMEHAELAYQMRTQYLLVDSVTDILALR
jgi:hypothetical protein